MAKTELHKTTVETLTLDELIPADERCALINRIAQTALRIVIEPIVEDRFHPHRYGCRPGGGCKDALRHADELLEAGHPHIVDVDIKGYF